MTWAYFNDTTPWHPKLVEVGPEAGWLWFSLICYSNAHKLNGRVSLGLLGVVAPWATAEGRDPLIQKLSRAGLVVRDKEGLVLHQYEQHQASALKSEQDRRETERETMRRYERDRKRLRRAEKRKQVSPLPAKDTPVSRTSAGHVRDSVRDNVPDCPAGCPGEGLGWDGISLDLRDSETSAEQDLQRPTSVAESARTPHKHPDAPKGKGINGHGVLKPQPRKASQPATTPHWRVWQLYEQLTGTIQGDASANLRPLEAISRVVIARAGGATVGPAFDAKAREMLEAWLRDPWVAEKRPPLGHLAKNPTKFGGHLKPARGLPAPVSSRESFAVAAMNNPSWLTDPVGPGETK